MTLEEYQKKLDGALDWFKEIGEESDAHKLLKKAAVDKEISLEDFAKLHDRYRKAVKKL